IHAFGIPHRIRGQGHLANGSKRQGEQKAPGHPSDFRVGLVSHADALHGRFSDHGLIAALPISSTLPWLFVLFTKACGGTACNSPFTQSMTGVPDVSASSMSFRAACLKAASASLVS